MGGAHARSEPHFPVARPVDERPESERRASCTLVAALSEIAAKVQRGRTVDEVLEAAGRGVTGLGMRLGAFQADGDDIVLRHVATSAARLAAIEARLGRSFEGLRVRLGTQPLIHGVVRGRRTVFREDLDVFDCFLREATGYDPSHLEVAPETASVTNGVLAPIFVADRPWGLLVLCSEKLTREDAGAVVLFATHVGSALEVAESLEALEKAQRKLVERERLAALGELAAVVAHEVRNPLGVLFNTVSALRSIVEQHLPAHAKDDARTLLGIAADESDRLNRIVGDLLAFGRPNGVVLEPVLVSQLLARVAFDACADRVVIDVSPNLPLLNIDARLVAQALLNLVLNALQASPTSKVVLRARSDASEGERTNVRRIDGRSRVRIDVIDEGPGIPDRVRDRIFAPFFTTKASGTGLGLAIVKRIVDAHDGEIAFTTSPAGTTFSVTFDTAKLD